MSSYLVFAIIPFLLGMYAQFKIKSAYNKYSSVRTKTGISGSEAARKMLDEHGLTDIRIEKVNGTLTDHYSPSERTLRLSDGVYNSNSIAAVGVACHEAGHAYQHSENYAPLKLRTAIVPMVNIGSHLGLILFMLGLALAGAFGDNNYTVAKIGLVLFAMTAVFAVITLPVEFDASKRAKAWLSDSGLLFDEEIDGVSDVLDAAALTYVSAAVQAIANVMYYASILSSRDRRNRR